MDGVRKSTRKRKNPYQSSEYIPVPKIRDGRDSDLSDDQADWVSSLSGCMLISSF